MLRNAPEDQVKLWNSVQVDERYYTVAQREYLPSDGGSRVDRWSHLAQGRKHWKTCMEECVGRVVALLRAFGAEPWCSICQGNHGPGFDTHTLSVKHYNAMRHLIEQSDDLDMVAELLWHETYVPGGRVKYNHLDGEMLVFRDKPVLEASVIHLHELWMSGAWIQVCAAAAVAAQPGWDKTMWPNMWSAWHWKQKMFTNVERVVKILTLNGALTSCQRCLICPEGWFSCEHLLGPKHYTTLVKLLPEKMPVQTETYTQYWSFLGGSIAYNHVTGTLLMLRRISGGNDPVAPPPPLAVMPQPLPPPPQPQPPPPLQPATSSTVAPPAVDMQLAAHQQQSASSTQQAPEEGLGAFRWFWQKVASRQAPQLEELVVAALDLVQIAAVLPYCELCQCRLPPCVSFAQHVSTDIGHMAKVLARFEQVGPDCRGWVQCWPGVAEFNHLTLDVVKLIARVGGSENSVAGDRASAHEVDEQLCAAVLPVTNDDAEDQEGTKHADPLWVKFVDPKTLDFWWYNQVTEETLWSEPEVSCGATESSHTSITVPLIAGTGGEPSDGSSFQC
jgi:hypothetical protein